MRDKTRQVRQDKWETRQVRDKTFDLFFAFRPSQVYARFSTLFWVRRREEPSQAKTNTRQRPSQKHSPYDHKIKRSIVYKPRYDKVHTKSPWGFTTRQGNTTQDKDRRHHNTTLTQHNTTLNKTRQDKTRQDKTRQDKTSLDCVKFLFPSGKG